MDNTTIKIPRTHLIMGLCLPLAVLLGYFLAEPQDNVTVTVVTMVLALFCVPALMKWHHPLLILIWNLAVAPVFLPGVPPPWLVMSVLGFVFAVLNRSVDPYRRFIWVPSLIWPILTLLAVVMGTAYITGGIGLRLFGSGQQGGKGYVMILGAVAGFFALCSQRIPPQRAGLYAGMFFLMSISAIIPELLAHGGPGFYFMFDVIGANGPIGSGGSNPTLEPEISRSGGLGLMCPGILSYLLAKHGMRGTLDPGRPFRLLILLAAFAGCLASGYRSGVILFVLICGCAFCLEGLWRTRLMPIMAALGLIAGLLVFSMGERLPLSAQRSLAFLPIPMDPGVKQSAKGSTEWRVEMWKLVWPQVPQYLFKGKGYNLDPNDLWMAQIGAGSGMDNASGMSGTMVAGDYHNGPLSVLIPFGIYGALAFLWFLFASISYLYRCLKFGDPALKNINSVLLAIFIARTILFMFVFGGFSGDLAVFLGLLGLGVSLNGLPARQTVEEEQEDSLNKFHETVSYYQ